MKKFRIIDFETTGLPPHAGIVEVGWTDLIWEGKSMEIGETHARLCDPGTPIEPEAMAVHHITQDMVKGAPPPGAVLDRLDEGADFIIAHNLRFEEQFYPVRKPKICTLKCARDLIPDQRSYKLQVLRYALGLDLDPTRCDPPHRAGPDTYATAGLLRHILIISAKMGGDFVNRLVEVTQSSVLKTIPFGKYRGMSFADVALTDRRYLLWVINNPQAEPEVILAAKKALGME